MTPSQGPISFPIPKKTQLAERPLLPCRSMRALSWKKSNNSWNPHNTQAKAENRDMYVEVICEDGSQTDGSFVLASAQLKRPDEHDLANSVRNGDGLVSVQATFLLRRSSCLRADR